MANSKKEVKEVKEVKQLQPQPAPQQEAPKAIPISPQALEEFGQILGVVLVNDNRLDPIRTHYVNMINQAYEASQKQPS